MIDQSQLQRQLDSELVPAPGHTDRLLEELSERAAGAGLLEAAYDSLDSPFGRLMIATTPIGVVRVGFENETEELFLSDLSNRVSARVLRAPRRLDDARRQLDEYFDGHRRAFELDLDWRLTLGFRRRVLRATAAIPFGETRSYRDVATTAGSPNAVRAAGSALATNPLPIIVPCHRVLRTDGGLGGFRGGIEMKRALLGYEGARLQSA